jgi:hypothetical protein
LIAKPHLTARRRDQRREQADQRRLARPVWSEQAEDVAGARGQREARNRPPAAEMSGDVDEADSVEVGSHSRRGHCYAARPCSVCGLGARVVAVERAVNLLERREDLLAARQMALLVAAAAAAIALEAHEIAEQPIAPRDQPLPLGGTSGRITARTSRHPDADRDDDAGQRQRDDARRPAVMRDAADLELQRLSSREGAAGCGDEHLALRRELALLFDLRGRQRRAAQTSSPRPRAVRASRESAARSSAIRSLPASDRPPARRCAPAGNGPWTLMRDAARRRHSATSLP